MANKNYSEFPAGTINTADIILQGDAGTGELEKVPISDIPNFANTDLTATTNRQHLFGSNTLQIIAGDPTFTAQATNFVLNDTSFGVQSQLSHSSGDLSIITNSVSGLQLTNSGSSLSTQILLSNGILQESASDSIQQTASTGSIDLTAPKINLTAPNIQIPVDEITGVETKIYGEDIAENMRYAFKINPNLPILTVGSEEIGNEADHYNVAAFDDTSVSLISVLTGTGTSALSVAPDQIFMQSTNYTFNAVQPFADNAAALAAGLTAGMIYRTGDLLKIVH